jgi:acylpyruvate hydrolase
LSSLVSRTTFISRDLHHEVELVVLVGKDGKHIPRDRAYEYIAGYGVGLDMTLRDVQSEAKKKGLPWSVAKGFDTSAPVSEFVHRDSVPDPHRLDIWLTVNGAVRQKSNTERMIFRVEDVIAYLSTVYTLEPGDLIFTGTPEGVGQVFPGDVLRGSIQSIGEVSAEVVQEIR